jgi:hypothetical protein
MSADRRLQLRARQHGAVALLFLLVLTTAVLGIFVSSISSSAIQVDREKQTAAALAQAKEALIGRAANDENRPGTLPCPDMDDDGDAESPLFSPGNHCPGGYIGRFPWRTLDVPDLRDGAGERLWYVVASTYRDAEAAEPVNPFVTPGELTLDDPGGSDRYAALIVAPGAVICSQDRSIGNSPASYLELENNDLDSDYVSRPTTGTACEQKNFNDRILAISPVELQPLMMKRIARIRYEMVAKLRAYYSECEVYPWAMTFENPATIVSFDSDPEVTEGLFPADRALPADWGADCDGLLGGPKAPQFLRLQQNSWYTSIPNLLREPAIYYAHGELTLINRDGGPAMNASALVIATGNALSGQARPSADLDKYLEGGNNSTGDDSFEAGISSGGFNDEVLLLPPLP